MTYSVAVLLYLSFRASPLHHTLPHRVGLSLATPAGSVVCTSSTLHFQLLSLANALCILTVPEPHSFLHFTRSLYSIHFSFIFSELGTWFSCLCTFKTLKPLTKQINVKQMVRSTYISDIHF